MTIDDIKDNFALLDEWDDRYRYVIELGRTLAPMSEADHTSENKVQGCTSQVWLARSLTRDASGAQVLHFVGDSDAHIVRGLVAILLAFYSDRTPQQILDTDAIALFEQLGLREHLTPQRSNGFRAMVERIRRDAREAIATAAT
ncbi:MAG: SufE family protein [Xanthobacteraceae bacterium]|jgi:cysteine desulfuration protein SufE|nr:SufE family protein [Xanthobacteraceae bacterium]